MGLDLSLTSTGIVFIDGTDIQTRKVTSKGKADDSLIQRTIRLNAIGSLIMSHVNKHLPELVCIEGPSMASKFGHPHDRSGLWWLMVNALMRQCTVVEVPPSNRMKYATGKGNAPKDAVLTDVVRRYQELVGQAIQSNDIADALVLAAMGARFLGSPVESCVPKRNLEAMDTVHWPTRKSGA